MSTTANAAQLITIGPEDIDRMMELEVASFDPSIQATRETILERLAMGHRMYGLDENGFLAAAVACSYARFDPDDLASFPKNEDDFSTQPVPDDYNAVFIYSRGVHPTRQGTGYSKTLVNKALSQAIADGCTYAVGNPRTASYAGSDPGSQHESIPANPRFRAAIDRYLAGGAFPSHEELMLDPSLVYFSHVPGCKFHWILPNFAPHDRASGGIRVIVYANYGRPQPA